MQSILNREVGPEEIAQVVQENIVELERLKAEQLERETQAELQNRNHTNTSMISKTDSRKETKPANYRENKKKTPNSRSQAYRQGQVRHGPNHNNNHNHNNHHNSHGPI